MNSPRSGMGSRMPRRCRLSHLLGCLASLLMMLPSSGKAADYRVQTLSLGRANHQIAPRRRGMIAERVYTQGATLDAYDLLSDETGSLSLHLDVRYSTDFALSPERRGESLYATKWNRFDLARSYVDWHPVEALELRAGRQWSRGVLGIRDFDGFHLRARPRLDASTRARVSAYGGREVQWSTTSFDPDAYEVPGLPRPYGDDAELEPGTPWLAGGALGVEWAQRSNVTFGYRRRWRTGRGETQTGSERLGLATSLTPVDPVTVTAHTSYHTLLQSVDRAELDVAWDLPGPAGTTTMGVAHRRPWFDSASIFNLFGARPHREARLSYRHRVEPLSSIFRISSWGRIYDGDPYADAVFWGNDRSARRLGGSLGHETRLQLLDRTWQWHSEVSAEAEPGRSRGQQGWVDTQLRAPVGWERLFVSGRVTFLALRPSDPRRREGYALNYLLGAEVPITDFGAFHVTTEWATGILQPDHINLFGTLELAFWR